MWVIFYRCVYNYSAVFLQAACPTTRKAVAPRHELASAVMLQRDRQFILQRNVCIHPRACCVIAVPHLPPLLLTLTLSLSLSVSLCVCLPFTRYRVQKSATTSFVSLVSLYGDQRRGPAPPHAVSEARAPSAAAHCSLPYLEVSPTKIAQRGGGE